MELIELSADHPDPAVIALGARLLREGRLVAFPTEKVYGLGANALDADAVARIFTAKGRPSFNPIIVHVASAELAQDVVREWPDMAAALARAFWPGPLTLVLPRKPHVPNIVTAGLDTVAVRVPAHPVALALLAAARLPVAAPSANKSTMLSPTTAAHVVQSLGDAVDLILDGGPTTVGIESTVIDLSGEQPTLLRPGTIALPNIEAVVGPVARATHAADGAARPSPGMMERHYSPRARLVLADVHDLEATLERERQTGGRVAALVLSDVTLPVASDDVRVVRAPTEAGAYAARLYATLHELDATGADVIVVEQVPAAVEWLGVRDRLQRATRR